MLGACTTWAAPSCRAASTWPSCLTMAITSHPASAATCRIIRPSGPPPMTATVSPRMRARIFKPVHRAGQRLGQRGMLQRNVIGNTERVLGDDARRNANEFGIGAVVEQQVVAEVLLAALAEVALPAGRGVERHDAVAGRKSVDSLAGLDHRAGQLVPEQRRRHDHARVVAAPENLEVRSAGQGGAHLHDQFARSSVGYRNALDANVFAPMEDGGLHGGAAVVDGALHRGPAVMDDAFNGCPAVKERVFNRGAAMLDRRLNRGTAMLDRGFNRGAAALDRAFHRAWHQAPPTLPPPGTGSIIIFIESALGCEATSIAATASSSGKRCEMSWVRSKPLR